MVCYWLFYKNGLLCMIVKLLISYIQSIDWIYTSLDLYHISSHLNYYSMYIFTVFTRNNLSVCLWNDHHHISSSLIDSLLAYIFFFYFFFIWMIVGGMLLAVWQEDMALYYCEMILSLYSVHWLILYLLRSVRIDYYFMSSSLINWIFTYFKKNLFF